MCGIFGYVGQKTNAAEIVLKGLKSLEYRGYDSWGIAVVPLLSHNSPSPSLILREGIPPLGLRGGQGALRNQIVIKKKVGKIGNATIDELPPGNFALGHTRWATHGGVTQKNAHPHLDCTGTIAVIHNGIIENYDEIKTDLMQKGHRFVSETDTEVAAHLIEELYNPTSPPLTLRGGNATIPPLRLRGGQEALRTFPEAVRLAFNSFTGLNAIIAIDNKHQTFVAARNGSPLVIGFGKNENFLASDAAALLPYTRKVYFLEDGEMAIVNKTVEIRNTKSNQVKKITPLELTWKFDQAQKGAFPFFMLKEIYEQPHIVSEISHLSHKQIEEIALMIKHAFGTYLVGCGSASYVCIAGSYLFSKIANMHVNWAVGSEFGYHLDFITKKSLVMALSQSGETMDTLEGIKKAKKRGATIFALVNVLGSTLYRLADKKLLIGAGPEKGVASTKALIGKLAHLTLLAYTLAGKFNEGQKVLENAVRSSEKVLEKNSVKNIQKLAKLLKKSQHTYVIGRGLSYPASLETALKIKEISYIHAEGFAAGELKHGVIALIEKGTPCIAFLPDDETYGANLAGAMELKARGGYIIGISHKPHEVFDYYLPVDDAKEATIIPNIIAGQLLAYYLTMEKGLDPDMPRNLAKSVTVK